MDKFDVQWEDHPNMAGDSFDVQWDEEPGSSPENPLQEQGVSNSERLTLQTFGPDAKGKIEWLQREPGQGGKGTGYLHPLDPANLAAPFMDVGEGLFSKNYGDLTKQYDAVEYQPGQIAIRPKGSQERWKVIDEQTGMFSKDIGMDLLEAVPEIMTMLSPAKTALQLGSQVAGGEVLRRDMGSIYGFKDSPGQALKEAALEGAGAATVGKALENVLPMARGAGTVLRKPQEMVERITGKTARDAISLEKAGLTQAKRTANLDTMDAGVARQKTGADLAAVKWKYGAELQQDKLDEWLAKMALRHESAGLAQTRRAINLETAEAGVARQKTGAELSKAKAQYRAELEEAEKVARADIEKGKLEAIIRAGQKPRPLPRTGASAGTPGRVNIGASMAPGREPSKFSFAEGVLKPVYDIKSKYFGKIPGLKHVLQRWFGEDLVSSLGSESMAVRDVNLRALAERIPQEEASRISAGYSEDMANLMLGSKVFKAVDEEARGAIARVSRGTASKADEQVMSKALRRVLENEDPEYLRTAIKAHQATEAPLKDAMAARSIKKADLARLEMQLGEDKLSAMGRAKKTFPELESSMAAHRATEIPLRQAGAKRAASMAAFARLEQDLGARSLANKAEHYPRPSPPVGWATKTLDFAGGTIQRIVDKGPQWLSGKAAKAPPRVQRAIKKLMDTYRRNPAAYATALAQAMLQEDFRSWARSEENGE